MKLPKNVHQRLHLVDVQDQLNDDMAIVLNVETVHRVQVEILRKVLVVED